MQDDFTWSVSIHGKKLHQIPNTPLTDILTPTTLHKLICTLDEATAVKSFVEEVCYLSTLSGAKGQYVLSDCFSHDFIENYFGQGHAQGSRCKNPTAKSPAQSLRVQGSLSLQPVWGNSSRKRRLLIFMGKMLLIIHLSQRKPNEHP